MTTRTEFTVRAATPPPEKKVLSDQELEDILAEAFEEMDLNEKTTKKPAPSAPLPPPVQSEEHDLEALLMQTMEKFQRGEITEEELEGILEQNPRLQEMMMQGMQMMQEIQRGGINQGELKEVMEQNPRLQEMMMQGMQMMQEIQRGEINEGELKKVMEQNPRLQEMGGNPSSSIRMGVQLFKENPQKLEAAMKQGMALHEEGLDKSNPNEKLILLFDSKSEEIKSLKIFTLLLTLEDQRSLKEAQGELKEGMGFASMSPVFDRLVQEKKAVYLTEEYLLDSEGQGKMKKMLQSLGIEEKSQDAMVIHKEIMIALSIMPFALLSAHEDLIDPFLAHLTKNFDEAMSDPLLSFIETLPSKRATQCKAECVAYLRKRLGL